MAGKIEAAQARLFKNVFVCKNCGAKLRVEARKIAEGKVRCRKCLAQIFKPKSRTVVK
jgi:predicted Zn finger-like uncharacterized protein